MYIPRTYGWIRDPALFHRPKYNLRQKVARVERPPVIDFRKNTLLGMPPILDQKTLGACTANSVAGVVRYLKMKQALPPQEIWTPSRLAIYYWEREIEGTVATDAGATIADQMKVVREIGCPNEALWPYDPSQFTVTPTLDVRTAAALCKVPQAKEYEIDTGLDGIMDSLEQGFPISLGFVVYKSFESIAVATTGIVPMPTLTTGWKFWSKPDEIAGGHAVWCCGYNQTTATVDDVPPRSIICANSWSTMWGSSGFFFLPFDYAVDGNLAGPFYSVQFVEESEIKETA